MPTQLSRPGHGALAALCAATALVAGGCARMDAALSQQWVVVQFNPSTTMATARHVTAACSKVPHVRLQTLTRNKAQTGLAESARYNVTHASDSDTSKLQECLQRFRSVQGLTVNEAGGY